MSSQYILDFGEHTSVLKKKWLLKTAEAKLKMAASAGLRAVRTTMSFASLLSRCALPLRIGRYYPSSKIAAATLSFRTFDQLIEPPCQEIHVVRPSSLESLGRHESANAIFLKFLLVVEQGGRCEDATALRDLRGALLRTS